MGIEIDMSTIWEETWPNIALFNKFHLRVY